MKSHGIHSEKKKRVRKRETKPTGEHQSVSPYCELWDTGDLSIVTATEQLVRSVVDRLRNEGHRTIAAQEVRTTRVTRLEAERDIPRIATRTSRVATIISVGSGIDWRDRTA